MSNLIQTILVDDEPDSLITIEEQLKIHCKDVNILGTYTDPNEGLANILQKKPDVVFLDINMPKLNGIQLARKVAPEGVKVVFLTAYKEYAFEAIKLSAIDYLLKPLQDFSELTNVINKVKSFNSSPAKQFPVFDQLIKNKQVNQFDPNTEIALADEKSIYFYKVNEIVRLKAERNFCRFFFTENRTMLVSKNLGSFIPALEEYGFVQVNRSELINIAHRKQIIKRGGIHLLMSDGSKIDISKNYKDNLPYYANKKKSIFRRITGG